MTSEDSVLERKDSYIGKSELGAKGAGDAGTAGATGAILNAINDTLISLGASVSDQPVTLKRVLQALGRF